MVSYAELKDKSSLFKHLTGLTMEAFKELLPTFEQVYQSSLEKQDKQRKKPRERQRGGGQKGAIPRIEDKLVFILVYFRHYPVQVLQGYLFGMGQSQANEWIHRLTPLLNEALGEEQHLPARQSKAVGELLQACPGLEFLIDGTERPIRRPKAPEKQREKYSGKKKRHTVKNLVITDKKSGKVKALSPTVEGKQHDKKLADEWHPVFPRGSSLGKDTGFQGYDPEGVHTWQPHKQPKGKDLSAEQKARNAQLSSQRIGVEHCIGGIKVFAIVGSIYRNLKDGFEDVVMETACGLHNLRKDYPMMA
jgi:hypothetical protein